MEGGREEFWNSLQLNLLREETFNSSYGSESMKGYVNSIRDTLGPEVPERGWEILVLYHGPGNRQSRISDLISNTQLFQQSTPKSSLSPKLSLCMKGSVLRELTLYGIKSTEIRNKEMQRIRERGDQQSSNQKVLDF